LPWWVLAEVGLGRALARWYAVRMQKAALRTPDAQHLHTVVRFLRKTTFPRLTLAAGETFGFVVVGKHASMVRCILRGERFEFGGGQALPEDVEVAFLGPCTTDYLAVAGYGASVVSSGPEPFALDFIVSVSADTETLNGQPQMHLLTVSGVVPKGRHLGSGHWVQIHMAIAKQYNEAQRSGFTAHFAGGLPLTLLAQDANPLKIEGLRVQRKGLVEPAYPLLAQQS
jgi:hypothetical protein